MAIFNRIFNQSADSQSDTPQGPQQLCLNCNEIYFSSTEKSLTSGSPGFGVRTTTRDMSADTAERIAAECASGYGISSDRQISFEDLERNPRIVYDFTPEYAFRRVELPDTKAYWTIVRTVYIATDYGFFGDRNGAMRVGSNYFTHIFVFDRNPTAAAVGAVMDASRWIPADYTASHDNSELKRLLTGDPEPLDPTTLTIEKQPLASAVSVPGMDLLTVALCQARDNRLAGKDPMLSKVIIIQQEALTPAMVKALGALPDALTEEMYFVTNYDRGYSVPDNLGMVFVNENNRLDLFTDNHITVDLIKGTTTNIDNSNIVYSEISRLMRTGDSITLATVLDWYASLDSETVKNPEFAYRLLMATSTPVPLDIDTTDSRFVRSVLEPKADAARRATFENKLNTLINETITTTDSGARLLKAIDIARTFDETAPGHAVLTPEAKSKLSRIAFLKGASGYLDKLVLPSNVDYWCKVLKPEDMGLAAEFISALGLSADVRVWDALLARYYRGIYSADMNTILDAIRKSRLTVTDKNDLVGRLFPLTSSASYISDMVEWYRRNPTAIFEIDEPVRGICMGAREECFSRLVGPDTPREVVNSLGQLVISYFRPRILENPNTAMEQVAMMIRRMTPAIFEQLDAMELFDLYLDEAYATPAESAVKVIDNIKRFGVRLPDKVLDRMNSLQCVLTGKIPAEVTVEVMNLVLRMPALDSGYVNRMSAKWIDSAPEPDEIKRFVKDSRISSPALIGGMIEAVWKSESRSIAPRRKAYIEAISDSARWSADEKKAYIAGLKDQQLADTLRKADSLFGKLFRKLF